MAGSQLIDEASASSGSSATSKHVVAKAELEKGAALHKQGALSAAVGHYCRALDILGIPLTELDGLKAIDNVPRDSVVSDALHWYGALHVQQLAKEENAGEDDEEDTKEGAPVSPAHTPIPRTLNEEKLKAVRKYVVILQAAVAALPDDTDAAKRARALNSVGTALLLLGLAGADEAVVVLREAVKLSPSSYAARSNLVKALRRKAKGAKPEVEDSLEVEVATVLEHMANMRPEHPGIFYRLGLSLKKINKTDDAIKALERHLEAARAAANADSKCDGKLPGAFSPWRTAQAQHWLAVMKGDNTATAPPEYVASLFDDYADHFEEHLVQKLSYRTPDLIAEDIRKLDLTITEWQRGVDLGCGTGLMCPPLRRLGFKGRLEGVDLSEGMLLQALKKGEAGVGYDRLLCGDILDIFEPLPEVADVPNPVQVEQVSKISRSLEGPDEASLYEIVVSADVFVYIGDLAPTFKTVAQWLKPGGVFAFSTEALDPQETVPFKLNQTGRYTHSLSYIQQLASNEGLSFCSSRAVVLRMNAGKPVNGHVHILRGKL